MTDTTQETSGRPNMVKYLLSWQQDYENQEQQDARHAVIRTLLHNIIDKLAEIKSDQAQETDPSSNLEDKVDLEENGNDTTQETSGRPNRVKYLPSWQQDYVMK
ncbi:hypothetical protein Lal_00001014 [Lupinus albus]|nr:hypothetical protein Lal_00001014 [Lupinus albus]